MSYMNRPHSDALRQALKDHGMGTKRPSQLSDAFRLGFWAAERSLADAQAEIARLRAALEKAIAEMEDDLVYIEAGEPGTCDRSHIDAALAVLNK